MVVDNIYRLKRLEEYQNWLKTANVGGKFIYHMGFSPQDTYISAHVAAQVYRDYENGYVVPFCKRKAPHIFDFIAVRLSKKI